MPLPPHASVGEPGDGNLRMGHHTPTIFISRYESPPPPPPIFFSAHTPLQKKGLLRKGILLYLRGAGIGPRGGR